jgi:hypothetical protein
MPAILRGVRLGAPLQQLPRGRFTLPRNVQTAIQMEQYIPNLKFRMKFS